MKIVNLLKKIKGLFEKECNHLFDIKDVCNLKIDPKCVKCGKPLNECKK